MASEDLQTGFNELVGLIKVQVEESKVKDLHLKVTRLMQRSRPDISSRTETGIQVMSSTQECFEEDDWFQVIFKIVQQIKKTREYYEVLTNVSSTAKKDIDKELLQQPDIGLSGRSPESLCFFVSLLFNSRFPK